MLGSVTRLLVDLNRPAGHPRCFSEFSRKFGPEARTELLETFHRPYWQAYAARVAEPGCCLHLACHSFVPVLDGHRRRTDIGLLFDPARGPEAAWCRLILKRLRIAFPSLHIHANQPYRGTSSGLGQFHRARFGSDKLLTAELEVNQALIEGADWPGLQNRLIDTLEATLTEVGELRPEGRRTGT
jgi:predicted N-formylglutamate amidohydrolase